MKKEESFPNFIDSIPERYSARISSKLKLWLAVTPEFYFFFLSVDFVWVGLGYSVLERALPLFIMLLTSVWCLWWSEEEASLRSFLVLIGDIISLISSGNPCLLNILRRRPDLDPSASSCSLSRESGFALAILVSRRSNKVKTVIFLLSFSFRRSSSVYRNLMSRPNKFSFVGFSNSFSGSLIFLRDE